MLSVRAERLTRTKTCTAVNNSTTGEFAGFCLRATVDVMRRVISRRKVGSGLVVFLSLTGLALVWSNHVVRSAGRGAIAHEVSTAPKRKVALVLGCSATVNSGAANLFFEHRMNAAFDLWKSGKAEYLLVSGDNHTASYDEPTQMMNALIQRGVPAKAIVRDYAGFRTLDSVVRAHRVFGESRLCIVSQEDHLMRAIYIAKHHGIEATGYAAKDVPLREGLRTKVREAFARLQAVLDVGLFARKPHFLGPRIVIGSEAG